LVEKGAVAGVFYVLALVVSGVLVARGFPAPAVGAVSAVVVATAIPLALWWRFSLHTRQEGHPSSAPEKTLWTLGEAQPQAGVDDPHAATLQRLGYRGFQMEVSRQAPIRIFVGESDFAERLQWWLYRENSEIGAVLASASFPRRREIHQHRIERVLELPSLLQREQAYFIHFCGYDRVDHASFLQKAAEDLAESPGVRCVVLAARHTDEQSRSFAERIDCVVGMSTAVSDRIAAFTFCVTFYKALASGFSVRDAMDCASTETHIGGVEAMAAPRLLARRCDPARIFLAKRGR
jgi:hypothetical protein